MDPRLSILPERFRGADVKVIVGERYVGTPKVAGLDNAAHVPEPWDGPIVYLDCTFDAGGASEALKLPKKFWIAFVDCSGLGGVEDVVDICRGAHVWFVRFTFQRGPAQRDVTCKGGAWDVNFIDCPGLNKIQLGEYSKYDAQAVYPDGRLVKAGLCTLARPATRGIHLFGVNPHVECIHAEDPIGPCQLTSPLRRGAAIYFWVRATFFKESNPAPADEFRLLPAELAV